MINFKVLDVENSEAFHRKQIMIYRSLQVYQRSNTQVGHRVLSDFTLKIVRQMSDQIVRPNPPRSE